MEAREKFGITESVFTELGLPGLMAGDEEKEEARRLFQRFSLLLMRGNAALFLNRIFHNCVLIFAPCFREREREGVYVPLVVLFEVASPRHHTTAWIGLHPPLAWTCGRPW